MDPFCAAVDWGTSSLRVWLLDREGNVMSEKRSDQGMSACTPDRFELVLEANLTELRAPQTLPAVVCGMAGARQGWFEAPYSQTPVALGDVAARAVRVPGTVRPVHILPGICQRDADAPDVMRGEETQLAGAYAGVEEGRATAVMPGTHSKWVYMRNGSVRSFRTFMTGELFAAIREHTVLQHSGRNHADVFDLEAFKTAVTRSLEAPGLLTANLFGVRSGELLGHHAGEATVSILSGLLIGTEIAAARDAGLAAGPVSLFAAGKLGERYIHALGLAGMSCVVVDADQAVRSGLHAAALALHGALKEGDAA